MAGCIPAVGRMCYTRASSIWSMHLYVSAAPPDNNVSTSWSCSTCRTVAYHASSAPLHGTLANNSGIAQKCNRLAQVLEACFGPFSVKVYKYGKVFLLEGCACLGCVFWSWWILASSNWCDQSSQIPQRCRCVVVRSSC